MFASSLLRESAAEGFVQAYDVLTSALAEEDDAFLRSVCEPVLADKLLAALADTKKKGLRLVKVVPPNNQKVFKVNYNVLSIHAFQPFDRNKQGKEMPMKTPAIEMYLNMDGMKNLELTNMALLTVVVEFDTDVRLKLVNRELGQAAETHSLVHNLETHRIEFAISREDFMKNMDFKSLVNFQGGNGFSDIFGKMFAGEKYEWFIYDIDDFMRSKALMNSN